MAAGGAFDWPLSREEKKVQIMRCYSQDVQTADRMLSSGEEALAALKDELDLARLAAGVQTRGEVPAHGSASEVERLRAEGETATVVLRATTPDSDSQAQRQAQRVPELPLAQLPARSEETPSESGETPREESSPSSPEPPCSHHALCETSVPEFFLIQTPRDGRAPSEQPSALRQTPRLSNGEVRKRVSFNKQPEEEPSGERKGPEHRTENADAPVSTVQEQACLHKANVQRTGPPQETRLAAPPGAMVHVVWLLFSVLLAVLAFHLGSRSRVPPVGDPGCWMDGFSWHQCCLGEGGNPACWDAVHSYARCCIPNDF